MSAVPFNQTWTVIVDTRHLVITIQIIAHLGIKEAKMVTNEERREIANKLYTTNLCDGADEQTTESFCKAAIKNLVSILGLQKESPIIELRWRLAKLIEPEPERTCEWRQDENGLYHTSCGEIYETIADTREENGIMFCPYCGREVVD